MEHQPVGVIFDRLRQAGFPPGLPECGERPVIDVVTGMSVWVSTPTKLTTVPKSTMRSMRMRNGCMRPPMRSRHDKGAARGMRTTPWTPVAVAPAKSKLLAYDESELA
jgi:hypothetical protein